MMREMIQKYQQQGTDGLEDAIADIEKMSKGGDAKLMVQLLTNAVTYLISEVQLLKAKNNN